MEWQEEIEEEEEEDIMMCPYQTRTSTENTYSPIHDKNKINPNGTRTYTSFEQCMGSACMAFNKKDSTCKRIL